MALITAPGRFSGRLSASMIMALLVSACTIDVDEPVESAVDDIAPVLSTEVEQPVTSEPTSSMFSDSITSTESTGNDQSTSLQVEQNTQPRNPVPNPEPMPDLRPEPGPQLDQDGIATSEAALAELLETDYVVESERVIPTTSWFCKDVFEENRFYYVYKSGVLSPDRSVLVERTLNRDDETRFNDIKFFWSVTSTDSILLSSLTEAEDETLVLSGQQYDISTIRFSENSSQPAFTAQSQLRGSLNCSALDFR